MSTTAANVATAPSTVQKIPARRYKDVLTPVLHTKFNSASLFILLVCYVIAVIIGDWRCKQTPRSHPILLLTPYIVFWGWFPLGFAGIRTLMLFVSSLSIYILRMAGLHGTLSLAFFSRKRLTCAKLAQERALHSYRHPTNSSSAERRYSLSSAMLFLAGGSVRCTYGPKLRMRTWDGSILASE